MQRFNRPADGFGQGLGRCTAARGLRIRGHASQLLSDLGVKLSQPQRVAWCISRPSDLVCIDIARGSACGAVGGEDERIGRRHAPAFSVPEENLSTCGIEHEVEIGSPRGVQVIASSSIPARHQPVWV